MSKLNTSFKILLVMGENPDEIVKLYSTDTKVEPYLFMRYADAEKKRAEEISRLEKVLNDEDDELTRLLVESHYEDVKDMTADEYFEMMTDGWCTIDSETGDAYTDRNPKAHYKYETCHQQRLVEEGEEGVFSTPFTLVDDCLSYSARKGEIDWSKMHLHNTEVYEAAWEMCVEGREPETLQEQTIKKNMANRAKYFANFSSKEDYVRYSTSFWTYGVCTAEKYEEVPDGSDGKGWITGFYERFIAPLPDDTLLTIYEAKAIS